MIPLFHGALHAWRDRHRVRPRLARPICPLGPRAARHRTAADPPA